jgi:hypothetical protein
MNLILGVNFETLNLSTFLAEKDSYYLATLPFFCQNFDGTNVSHKRANHDSIFREAEQVQGCGEQKLALQTNSVMRATLRLINTNDLG